MKNFKLRDVIEYNSPVILSYFILTMCVFFIDQLLPIEVINNFFVFRGGHISLHYFFTLISYPIGHASIEHLMGNMTIFLLIGPMLEEKYSSKIILLLIFITTILTGLLHVFFNTGILGASGIVFMMIVLTSFTNMKDGKIPLTFICIVILFLIKEIYNGIFVNNNISELAHLFGAFIGIIYIIIDSRLHRKKPDLEVNT